MKVKNWSKFQHFKDRKPLWIKLYRDLLDDVKWASLAPETAKRLVMIWLVASENEGTLPSIEELAFRLRCSTDDMLDSLEELHEANFIVDMEEVDEYAGKWPSASQEIRDRNGFASRHITNEVKGLVWQRDNGRCVRCGAMEKIEYDHIHPVSKGGESTVDNLQLLCRKCNRSKRAAHAYQLATTAQKTLIQADSCSRSLEKRRDREETETETETEKRQRREEKRIADDNCEKPRKRVAKRELLESSDQLSEVWISYATAYAERYGAQPIRNAKSNSVLKRFRQSVPAAEAAEIAGFYVRHNSSWYVQRMHPLEFLLNDATKLRTEWITGARMTQTRALQVDRTQSMLDVVREIEQGGGL